MQACLDDGVAALTRGAKLWYKKDASTWLQAELREHSGDGAKASIVLPSGKAVEGVPLAQLVPANPELQSSIADMTQLSYLNEPSIISNLETRYGGDCIYTNAGAVLIAVNPCKTVPLYTADIARSYKVSAHEALNQLDPHIYLVAGNAFRAMVREGTSQSLVINGESGAGKTETTKKAMQFFAQLAGGTGVEDQVLETNPILEAFGNAKTLRNHNSSRFGKLIEIHFNKTHHICGARIRTYLLEKSRMVHRLKGERSFHAFYQLLRGASKEERAAYMLPAKPGDFKYLSNSGCMEIDGVDDAADFVEVKAALADVGIGPERQAALFSLLSGVLWLGNVTVDAVHADDSSAIRRDVALVAASTLLGLEQDALATALTHKEIRTKDELIVKPLNRDEARDARDALAKAVYEGIFAWLVAAINAKLDTGKRSSGQFIAILDIYGFEQFQTNSFEQLCINYANERLQQQFTRHLFTLEQEEYEAQGIDWTKVEWLDNQACLDAIEAMPPKGLGVLAVLDSQCKFPKSNDDTLLNALRDTLGNTPCFGLDPRKQNQFVISHYAGPVAYATAGFIDKNKDTLNADIVRVLAASSLEMVAGIGAALSDDSSHSNTGSASPLGPSAASKRAGQTVSSRFSTQLRELVAMLDATGLHFVRCIKPNGALRPSAFDYELVLQQLRCCGVLEVARVSRAGFPTRYTHSQFVQRYKVLLPPGQQSAAVLEGGGVLGAVKQLLAAFKVQEGQYEVGRTKIFFRPGVLGMVEDTWARMQASVLLLQSMARMWNARRAYQRMRSAATLLASSFRARQVRLAYGALIRQHAAARTVQKHYRGFAARKHFQQARQAAIAIQVAVRGRALNRRVARRTAERQAREAAEAAAAAEKREREEGFEAMKRQYGVNSLADVHAAMAVYGTMKQELDARDVGELRRALAVYGALQRQLGGGSGDDAKIVGEVQAALTLLPAAREYGATDAKALRSSLALAAAVRREMGPDAAPDPVAASLAQLAAIQAAAGTTDAKALASGVSMAAAATQAGVRDAAQAEAALALYAAARQQGIADAAQLSQALAVSAAAGAKTAQEAAAAGAAYAQVQQAGLHEMPGALEAALAVAAAASAAGLGSAEEVASAGALADVAKQHSVASSPQALSTALESAAALSAVGVVNAEQAREAAAVYATAKQHNMAEASALTAALAAVSVAAARHGDGSDPRRVRRALSMYSAASEAGLAEKRDFQAAAAIYNVLKEEGLTSPQELQAAVAMFTAVRQAEGLSDPVEVQAAFDTYAAAKQANNGSAPDVDEVRLALAAWRSNGNDSFRSRDGMQVDPPSPGIRVGVNGGPYSSTTASVNETSPRSVASSGIGGGGAAAAITADAAAADSDAVVASLRRQLSAERRARQRYATRLEEQAVEWMEQVRMLKEYIDTLRGKLPTATPPAPLPAAGPGGANPAAAAANGSAVEASHVLWAPLAGTQQQQQQQRQLQQQQSGISTAVSPTHASVGWLSAPPPRVLSQQLSAAAPRFEQDARFLQEVGEGAAAAPNMDAEHELERLRSKHEQWNSQFKEQLRDAQAALWRRQQSALRAPAGAPTVVPPAPALVVADSARQSSESTSSGVSGNARSVNVSSIPNLEDPALLEGAAAGKAPAKKSKKLFGMLRK